MTDQIIVLRAALQLANREFELHRRKQKSALATLDALERTKALTAWCNSGHRSTKTVLVNL